MLQTGALFFAVFPQDADDCRSIEVTMAPPAQESIALDRCINCTSGIDCFKSV
jgi:hypothetical protein